MASQVQLANTFNEFREAYNTAANQITSIIEGTGALYANTGQVGDLVPGRVLFGGTPGSGAGALLDDSADLAWNNSVKKLTLIGSADISENLRVNTLNVNNTVAFLGSLTTANTSANNLTNGRVVFAGASGLLSDDAELRYVTANNALLAANVTIDNRLALSTLTSGRVVLASIDGEITDNSGLTYQSSELSVTGKVTATTWANAANMNVTNTVQVGANVNVTDTVNALGHLHAGGVEAWITAKGEDRDIHLIAAVDDNDGPHDVAIVNRNNNANAYGEFIAMNNAGNTDQGWVSMGINSTNYNQGAFAITKGDDAYLLYQAPSGTTKEGDLIIGTGGNGTKNRIIFSADGFDDPANNTQIVINPGNNVHIEIDTESTSTTTGALTINGGLGLVGNMNVGGNVAITGTITLTGSGNTVSTDSLAVANAILFLANGSTTDSLDVGLVGQYNQGGDKYFGFVRDQSDNNIKIFQDLATRPANTTNFASVNYANTRVGVLHASNTAAASNPSTGALIVGGGAGINGGIWAGGSIRTDDTTASSSTSTGALIINGGAGIAGAVYAGSIQNTPIGSTTRSTGAFSTIESTGTVNSNGTYGFTTTVSGGQQLRLYGSATSTGQWDIYQNGANLRLSENTANTQSIVRIDTPLGVTGALFANSSTAATSTSTGALIVTGGAGIAGNTHVGGDLVVTGSIIANEVVEGVTDVAVSTNTYTCNYNDGNIFYATTAPSSADFTLALTNVPTTNGRITTVSLILPQGATARRPSSNAISINGTSTLVNWVGGNTAITPTASKTDIFNFTILRRSNTFTVAGTLTANTVL